MYTVVSDSFGGHPVFRPWVHGLGCYWSLDWAMTSTLPILTAGVLYLGVCPTLRLNEPQVSQGARSSALAKPHSPLSLPFLIPESSGTLQYPGCPSPDAPRGAWGLRNGAAVQAGAIVPQSGFVLILLAGGRRGAKG